MTKLLLVNGIVTETTTEIDNIFELIQDNKQFIFVEEQYPDSEDNCGYSRGLVNKRQIAINIEHIVKVF